MAIQAIDWAWKQEIPSTQKLVLLALADYANQESYTAWPSMQTLANKCSLDQSTIQRALKKLQKSGLLRREKRGRGATNLYYLPINDSAPEGTLSNPRYPLENEAGSMPIGTCTGKGEVYAESPTEPSTEPSNNRQKVLARKSAHKRGSVKKRLPTDCPDHIEITESMLRFAEQHGITDRRTIDDLTEYFINLHKSKGSIYFDWQAGWCAWIRQQAKTRKT